jgi:hypothetical protein
MWFSGKKGYLGELRKIIAKISFCPHSGFAFLEEEDEEENEKIVVKVFRLSLVTDHTTAGPVVNASNETGGWTGWQPAGSNKKSRPPPKTTLFSYYCYCIISILGRLDFPGIFDVAFAFTG